MSSEIYMLIENMEINHWEIENTENMFWEISNNMKAKLSIVVVSKLQLRDNFICISIYHDCQYLNSMTFKTIVQDWRNYT